MTKRGWKIWHGTSSGHASPRKECYIPADSSKVLYRSKDGSQHKTFDALDWLAFLTTHIHDSYEQTKVLRLLFQPGTGRPEKVKS